MASGTLYTYPENFRAFKALIAAKYSGSSLTVDPNFKFGETNKSAEFTKKFPLGKVPSFEGKDGVTLFEPNAIAYYVANDALRGNTVVDRAYVQQWLEFADSEILPASCTWVFPCMGVMQYNKQATEKAKEDVKKVMQLLNEHLLTRTFLVGERVSLADIAVCCNLLQLYQWVMDDAFRQPYQNVNRWFTTLINQPHFKTVIGDFKFCEKMAQFDAKKFNELSGGGKKDKPKKEQQPKKEAPKKAEKKAEPAAADTAAGDDEPVLEKRPKDPFAHLPPSSMVMDDWKKMYSNNELSVSLPYFWEHFNKETMSIWKCEYMFAEQLRMTFMTANLVSGMFQRLDRMRKHAFGSMGIFGEDNSNTISGLWVWRGQQLAFELSEDLQIDYESYKWTKLDPDSDETKKLVEDYFNLDDALTFNGKQLNEGKIFK